MRRDDPAHAAPQGTKADLRSHGVPRLEGPASRSHERRPARRLKAEAWLAALTAKDAPRAFVQFAGFPRSGHSLFGALLDAHPNAAVSHELDAMGLYAKGVPLRRLPALATRYAKRFRADGQWWNGLRYEVPGAPPPGRVLVAGDKKGDWATRWCAGDEGLWPRMRAEAGTLRLPMILVIRHPLDNIATMSLRQGRTYDRLRIAHRGAGFGEAVKAAQARGEVPGAASDEMIEDYAALCAATHRLNGQTPDEDWLNIVYEQATRAPTEALTRLLAFLGLPEDEAWRAAAAAVIRPSGESRGKVSWSAAQRARVDEIVRTYPFLAPYRG